MDAADTVGRTARTSAQTAGGPMPGTLQIYKFPFREFVNLLGTGLEPVTPSMSRRYSNQLS